jgi:hypothetical protein
MVQQSHSGEGPTHYRGFTITLRHTTCSVGLLWTSLPINTQQSQETSVYALGGIRTRNPSKTAAADARLRPRDTRFGIHFITKNLARYQPQTWHLNETFKYKSTEMYV